MPRFDSIARAAVTPGGFQAGVNDIVAAILDADAKKALAAKEQAALAQRGAERSEEMGFRRDVENRRAQEAGFDQEFRGKSLGETIRHNTAMEQRPSGGRDNPGLDALRQLQLDEAEANLAAGLSSEGVGWADQEIPPDPLDIGGKPTFKRVKSVSEEQEAKKAEALKAIRAQRSWAPGTKPTAPSITAGVVPGGPKAATAPQSPGAAATPAPLGPPAQARKPLDYTALDAKYQAESPVYRQKRSDPSFDWKAFLDARAPRN